ncbi:MAG: LCP family protein [Candidatus Moraniibacteriota bacterium]|nr:MAG: LCP family protein [Candidatus Moranbacteria bacterium]
MTSQSANTVNSPNKKKRIIRIVLFFVVLGLIAGGVFAIKAGFVFNKISLGKDSIFRNLAKSLPGAKDELKGEADGRVNVLLLGMRGENVPGGGLLADTIMVLSLHPKDAEKEGGDTARASLVSIPRDLYVKVPGRDEQRKINAVYALGEERGKGGGIEDMRTIVGEVTGQTIPYAVVINFQGFIDLVNAIGGVTVTLNEPFSEGVQFREPHVCDANVYTVPTRPPQYEHKYYTRSEGTRYIAKSYLLCYNKDQECGGVFELPAGPNELDGNKALCYARARYQSSDFRRAERQQLVIQAIKDKALSAGTLTDFGKINALLDSLGDNLLINMEAWEAKRFFELYQANQDATLTQRVLEDSEEGLLYAPPATPESGYILLPRGDTYDRIRALFQSLP